MMVYCCSGGTDFYLERISKLALTHVLIVAREVGGELLGGGKID